jgi:hypothetical protein
VTAGTRTRVGVLRLRRAALRPVHAGWLFAATLAVAALAWPASAEAPQGTGDRRLPDRDTFLREVRKRLRSDQAILQHYVYRRHQIDRERDGDGRITSMRRRVWEVLPLPDRGEGFRVMLVRDGRPVPESEIAEERAEYQDQLARAVRRLETESAGDRSRREARESEQAREERENVEDVVRLYRVELVRRETIRGIDSVLLTFSPRAGVEPRTRAGRILKSVGGRAWFSEREHELVRVEAEVIDTIRYGWGILARIHKGASAHVDRSRAPDGRWLPHKYEFQGSGRLLLVKGLHRDTTVTFSDYRPFEEFE